MDSRSSVSLPPAIQATGLLTFALAGFTPPLNTPAFLWTYGPRILPHFGGVHGIFSKRLMFFSLLLLQLGCTLRVSSEPLAYEGLLPFAWKVLPVSGMLELSGVLLFAANLALTFLLGRSAFAHTRA